MQLDYCSEFGESSQKVLELRHLRPSDVFIVLFEQI